MWHKNAFSIFGTIQAKFSFKIPFANSKFKTIQIYICVYVFVSNTLEIQYFVGSQTQLGMSGNKAPKHTLHNDLYSFYTSRIQIRKLSQKIITNSNLICLRFKLTCKWIHQCP